MLIRGGRVVDPLQGIDAIADVRVRGGRIAAIGEHLDAEQGEQILDAANAYVAPGFVDMHVHLREPGEPEKETRSSGGSAAVAGGFTAVAAMPNTHPAIDTPELVASVRGIAGSRIYPIAAITRERRGTEPLGYAALARAGAVGFSDDGNTVMDAAVLRRAALAARDVPGRFISHSEDERLKGGGVMNLGETSRRMGVPGSPAIAEDVIVARDAILALETGKAWHMAHLSTRGALSQVRMGRSAGANISVEVAPHHLALTEAVVERLGAGAKVNPPLRSAADAAALRDAVRTGEIDAFASDHAPHTQAQKTGDLAAAAAGFSGLEVAVGAYAHALPDLPIAQFVRMLSTNPARILGVPGGTLAVGSPADLTIFADREWRVDPAQFRSKGKSTPFAGMVLPRRVLATIVGGALAYEAPATLSCATRVEP